MIVYDFEVTKHDWLICFLDTETRKMYEIVNNVEHFRKFYDYYKHRIWVGYNSRGYDQWIAKAILAGFNPYEMSTWIIDKDRKGFEFSKLLNDYPILNYDCSVGFRSLKELEAFMGDAIVETSVPFTIDRKLTDSELKEMIKYCKHDVWETFKVFIETKSEFESHVGLINEFGMDMSYINKTKAQLSAEILGASKRERDDEYDISFPPTLRLGKYDWIRDWYCNWADEIKDDSAKLECNVAGVPHVFGLGGLHGAIRNYYGVGHYLMIDVASYYPALMIEYNFLSRNVLNPKKYRDIRDERIRLKGVKDPREYPRKIVLNSTFGASKDKYNKLYDPLQANNVCIGGQLLLTDLIDKLEGKCELIQSNTDGVLVKLHNVGDEENIKLICEEWCERTRMSLEYDKFVKVFQKDVNNYVIVPEGDLYDSKGKPRWKAKGAYVKHLNTLDNDLPIVNKAVVDYLIKNIPVEVTISKADNLIDFQKITKISHSKYDWIVYKGEILSEKVVRCFASKLESDDTIYKKHKTKVTLDKTASTPEKAFIYNDDIVGKKVPDYLDKNWYIDLAKKRISDFLGE
jgi:hypothetical protein